MIFFWLYLAAFVAAIIWVTLDKYASGTFEIFSKNLHQCARAMGKYSEWLRYCLGRGALLLTLVVISISATLGTFFTNPMELGVSGQWMLLAAMLAGTALLIALPRITDRLRLMNLIYWATSAVSTQFSLSNWQSAIQETWDIADYETSQNWCAWHPRQEEFDSVTIWRYLVPVIYLKQDEQPSLVVPYMWEYFLAWNWPGEVRVEEPLPFTGPGDARFLVKSSRQLPRRPGWTVIHAEMEDFEGVQIAA